MVTYIYLINFQPDGRSNENANAESVPNDLMAEIDEKLKTHLEI